MNLGTVLAFIVGAILGVGLARITKNRGIAKIRVRRDMSASPDSIIRLIEQVEREPEMIPFVRSVEVLRRRGDSVRYRITLGPGNRFWAIYNKSVNPKKRRVQWRSEAGAFGLDHSGRIDFRGIPEGFRAELTSEFSFAQPVVGPLLAMMAEWWVAGAMFAWLRNLDRKALEE